MSETIEHRVWVASGPVSRNSILKTAVEAVRDSIPIVSDLNAEVTSGVKQQQDGQDGTEYTVTVTYTPRGEAHAADAVNVDHVVASLEPPKFDTILDSAHPEDAA